MRAAFASLFYSFAAGPQPKMGACLCIRMSGCKTRCSWTIARTHQDQLIQVWLRSRHYCTLMAAGSCHGMGLVKAACMHLPGAQACSVHGSQMLARTQAPDRPPHVTGL